MVLLLLTAALAGCLGGDQGDVDDKAGTGGDDVPVPQDWAARALPYDGGHDHRDPAHHVNLTTPNLEVHGYDPLQTEYHNATSGDYFCGEVSTVGDRRIAATHSFGTDVALVLVDVTDPTNPQKVGELALPNTHVYDVAITEDASYALLGTTPLGTGSDDGPTGKHGLVHTMQPTFTDACGNTFQGPAEQVPYDSGLVLVDITNPEEPEIVDYEPQPALGVHSVFATSVDGTTYVLTGVTNLAHTNSYFGFFTIEETPVGAQLMSYGTWSSSTPGDDPEAEQPPLTNGHVDGWIQKHPGTGQLLAYLANWNGGLMVLEMQGSGQLEELGRWSDWDPDAGSGMVGQYHGARPLDTTWDGKHYTFVGQEVSQRPAERPSGQVVMLDTTDPANPEPVARWTLPSDVSWDGTLQFSTHYFDVDQEERVLYVSTYHGGLWAVDADPSQGPELPSLGVFVPDRVPPNPQPDGLSDYSYTWTPIVMDAWVMDDGHVFTMDGQSGAYILEFHRDVPVPTPDPWTQDAWIEG